MKESNEIYLSNSPRIVLYKGIFNKKDCKELITIGHKSLKKSGTKNKDLEYRKSEVSNISKEEVISKRIINTINLYIPLCSNEFEKMHIQRYQKGDFYLPHYDAFDSFDLRNKSKRQRKSTLLIYLNDNLSGGETLFPLKDISIKGTTGDMLVFQNCFDKSDYLHPSSLHQSLEITKGEKWILTLWSYRDLTENS